MASAFATGFLAGQRGYQQVLDNDRQRVIDERAAEEFARKKQDWQKADELEAQVKGLSEQITNPNASNYRIGGNPVGLKMPGQAAPADAAPGDMPSTDFSFGPAAAGGLKAPKAFALADTPGAAVAPAPDAVGLRGSAFPASGVSLKAGPSASEEQAILAKIALLKGDIQGFNSARQAGKAADKDAVFAEAMKAPMPEVIAAAPKLNSMGIPLLYTGKSKDGKYTFLKTEADGYTPVDGSQFTLNESQMRQFYAASQLADKGFGADAMNLLSAANKDVADYIGKWNSTQSAVATANNTAQGKADEAEYRSGVLAETSRHNRATEGIQSANATNQRRALGNAYKNIREFVDAKGNTVLLDLNNLQPGADGTLAIPQGLRPKTARPEVTQKDIVDYAKALVENQTRDPDAPSKPLTLDKALQVARAQLSGEGYTSAADKLVQAYLANRGQTPPAEAPKAPGLTPPARKPITTIVPPRTAADMAPKTPLSDEDITKMLATKLPAR